ncbi:MAG: helix-turn-helix domain-containing protein [Phycicoccus sp.]|nr:helix-turn-helix domain-containing protein [Phycicoccus sp.]
MSDDTVQRWQTRGSGGVVTASEVAPECERLWTIHDVSAFLAVPVGTLYQWRHKGEGPPFIRLGKHLRSDPASVRAWVSGQAA